MFKRDYLAEGRAEGLTEGLAKGLNEGMAKGLNEGMAKGEERERLNTIRKLMKSLKMTASQAMALLEIPSSEQGKYLDRL
jgi:flagellar biosynthesis/type III secretory pathway protein FliH